MTKMTDDQLRAIVDSEQRQAVGYWSGLLAYQRQKAMYFYLGEAKGDLAPPEIEGRSKVVAPVVRNTIESMLPQLEVKFSGSDHPVEFEATKPGDEEKAQQATDYISYLYNVKNRGRVVTYQWMKDALLSKNGIIKVWWDARVEEKREEYCELSEIELAQVMEDDEVEVIEQSSKPDHEDQEQREAAIAQLTQQLQQAQQAAQQGNAQALQAVIQIQAQIDSIKQKPPALLYDITVKRTKDQGRVRVENVPPEEFLISRRAKTIEDAPFVGHRVQMTRSQLESLGYKNIDTSSGDDAAAALNIERVERLSWDDEMAYVQQASESMDESQRLIWVTECYVRVDYDGDGITELRKVLKVGHQVLENEVVDCAPFVSITPVPMPHKFFGLSVADLAIEGQVTETSILRAVLDNTYLQVNGRYFAVDGQVNLDDLLVSRPGGVVRVKQQGAVGRLDQGAGDTGTGMAMLEYMKGFNEDSTGWTRYNQGSDGDSLNHTATGVTQITSRADMRVDLIARNFAEGFKDLFRMMLKLVSQYQQKEAVVNLRGRWVQVNPRDWRNGFETTINVGLGTGNKDQMVNHLVALLMQQQQGLVIGTVTPENVYNAQAELAKAMGFKSGEKFFSDPAQMPPRPPQPNPEQIKAQTQMQIAQMQIQAEMQKEQMRLQAEQQWKVFELQSKIAEIEKAHEAKIAELQGSQQIQASNDERDAIREAQRAQMDLQIKAEEQAYADRLEQAKLELEKYKADLDAQVKLAIAQQAQAPQVDAKPADDSLKQVLSMLAAPSEIVRDPQSGRAIGIRKVTQ